MPVLPRALLGALLTAATAVASGAAFLALPAAPATADPLADCTATSGAIVAVDFGHFGGPVVRGCDAHPSTGMNLLHNGGFTTAGTAHDGPGPRPPAAAGTTTPAGRAAAGPTRSAAATSTPAGSGPAGPDAAANQAVPSGTGPPTVDVAPDAAAAAHPSGSATPALVAGGLVLVLGAGAGYATWRRRRAS